MTRKAHLLIFVVSSLVAFVVLVYFLRPEAEQEQAHVLVPHEAPRLSPGLRDLVQNLPPPSCAQLTEASSLFSLYKRDFVLAHLPEQVRWPYSFKDPLGRQQMLATFIANIVATYPTLARGQEDIIFDDPQLFKPRPEAPHAPLSEAVTRAFQTQLRELLAQAPPDLAKEDLEASLLASFQRQRRLVGEDTLLQTLTKGKRLVMAQDFSCPLPLRSPLDSLPLFKVAAASEDATQKQEEPVTLVHSLFCSSCRRDIPPLLSKLQGIPNLNLRWALGPTPTPGDYAAFDLAACGVFKDYQQIFTTPLQVSQSYQDVLDFWKEQLPEETQAIAACTGSAAALAARQQVAHLNAARSDNEFLVVLSGQFPLREIIWTQLR